MQTVFDTIKDRLPITDVLATYITLIPSGSQVKAKCPFHNERSASFSVSPDRGLYYCFGCGAKGDIFTFVEQFEGLDRKGALKVLADRAGVVLTNDYTKRESTDALYDLLEATTTQYQIELTRHPDILEYLKERGIEPKTIETFRIGYAPDEWRYVANTLQSEKDAAIGERAGLVKKTEKGYYDRFRKRIMFPLTDASGRVVGFSGRLYPADTQTADGNQSPKYLNSPETELFQKSRILFAFDKAKTAIRTHHFAILVEGQMDAVLAHQAGFKNTVATSGTAVSDQAAADPTANLAVLARLTPNVFLAFDGDRAGQKALDHAAIVALTLGMNPKVVPLPEGVDPADYIKAHGAEGWKSLLKESQHFILHQLRMIDRHTMSAHVLVQTMKERIFPFLTKVLSPVEQSSYIEAIAKHLELTAADIRRELALYAAHTEVPSTATPAPTTTLVDVITLAERFVALVTRYPSTVATTEQSRLGALTFEDSAYTLPTIPEEKVAVLMALVERDYGALPDDERDLLIRELAKKLEEQFFAQIRLTYSRALEVAERESREVDAQKIMQALQLLNQRLHSG
ncbi:MAG: DNA primase [Candidatus Pacebacteria bacterium]|nr:DNA primase [Candidatus Paceibacterota bacterium]